MSCGGAPLVNGKLPSLAHGVCPCCHYLLVMESPNYIGALCNACWGPVERYMDPDGLYVYVGSDKPQVAAEDLIE